MQANFRFIRNSENSIDQVKDYIHSRLPRGVEYSKEDIKVTIVWFDYNNRQESFVEKPGFLQSRKIVLERSKGSKVREGFKAYFITLVGMAKEKYSFSEDKEYEINRAMEKLLDDDALHDVLEGKEHISKVFYTCRIITHYVSIYTDHYDGPNIEDKTGVEIASRAGEISSKVIKVAAAVLSLFAAFFKR